VIRKHKAKDGAASYGVRVYRGGGRWEWIGTFPKLGAAHGDPETEARAAEHKALADPGRRRLTCDEYAARFLAEYEAQHKDSSYDTAKRGLQPFLRRFGRRPLDDIGRLEAKDWVAEAKPSHVPIIVTMFNRAAHEDELLERNPFRGLGRRSKGRAEERPPTEEELTALRDACSALGDYAPTMRAMLTFAAYTGMRPGELYALEWADVDFERMRVQVRRRLYRGRLDLPKSNRVREIALTPPARDAILGLPRDRALVFVGKRGGRLTQPTLSGYWSQVLARAELDFDFYLATKHYAVHYLYAKLNLPPRVIAEQMGWTVDGVLKLLRVYGHGEVGALEEIDRAFGQNVQPLRPRSVDSRTSDAHGSA
jgi:integrase